MKFRARGKKLICKGTSHVHLVALRENFSILPPFPLNLMSDFVNPSTRAQISASEFTAAHVSWLPRLPLLPLHFLHPALPLPQSTLFIGLLLLFVSRSHTLHRRLSSTSALSLHFEFSLIFLPFSMNCFGSALWMTQKVPRVLEKTMSHLRLCGCKLHSSKSQVQRDMTTEKRGKRTSRDIVQFQCLSYAWGSSVFGTL